mgnify:CR=1 FL=1
MGNKNTLAVASLTDTACIVLAEGVSLDDGTLAKAEEEALPLRRRSFRYLTWLLRSTRQEIYESLFYDLHIHSCLSPCGMMI